MFQVNQETKSGKWKCRMCGEGQSIVKVWGRGGHAKDVRGLVMELNAAAGRGEDPQVVLRRGLGREPGSQPQAHSQPSTLTQRPQPRHDGRAFSPSNASQLGFAQGTEELMSSGRQAGWGQYGGFMPAGLAPDGSGGGDETAVDCWGSGADGVGQLGFGGEHPRKACHEAGSVGFGARGESAGGARHHHRAPAWSQQTSGRPPGGGGRGGSRWGVFASDRRAAQGLGGRREGSNQQAQDDSNFVTSLEDAAPARRGKIRNRPQATNPEEEERGQPAPSRSRWALGGETREDPDHVTASAGLAEAREQEPPPRRQKVWSNKPRRREWGSPSRPPPRADQVDEPPTMMMTNWGGDSGDFREDRAGFVEPHASGNGGGDAQVAGGVRAVQAGASSSSSRWSKFLR
eukprot:g7939.t1